MLTQSCRPYRGYVILVRTVETDSPSFNGTERRFATSWSIEKAGPLSNVVGSFAEPVKFVSANEALRYAEGRAHTFIDSTFAWAETE
ncbi:hypothetical protein OKW28_007301 [Paraburkholderia sp. 40]